MSYFPELSLSTDGERIYEGAWLFNDDEGRWEDNVLALNLATGANEWTKNAADLTDACSWVDVSDILDYALGHGLVLVSVRAQLKSWEPTKIRWAALDSSDGSLQWISQVAADSSGLKLAALPESLEFALSIQAIWHILCAVSV